MNRGLCGRFWFQFLPVWIARLLVQYLWQIFESTNGDYTEITAYNETGILIWEMCRFLVFCCDGSDCFIIPCFERFFDYYSSNTIR